MKGKKLTNKKSSAGFKRSKNFSIESDPFFNEHEPKKRRTVLEDDVIDSSDSDQDERFVEEKEDDEEEETAGEKRKRVAEALIEKIRAMEKKGDGERDEGEDEDEERAREREGERDSRIANFLQQQQLEDSGRVRRLIASRVQKPVDEFRLLVKHTKSVTAVSLSGDDMRGYSASKDGTIVHWDVEIGKMEKYHWPNDVLIKSHGARDPQGSAKKHSKHVSALAVSSDGRYLATGGLDRHVHLWDTRTRHHIQAFQGHKAPVSCLSFRQGSPELFSGSFDRTIKIWNVDDRAYVNSLFGHQSEILDIDCLRKERVLTVGRDRSMQLFKVPEESRLVFRAPASSLECCCFVGNDEFLSGSDDGSIELWNVLRKKPVCIVRNAHVMVGNDRANEESNVGISNGLTENGNHNPASHSCASANSWVSSVHICRGSDLAASGAGNGCVRLWAIESETKGIRPLYDLPLDGFVNSLAIAKSGKFIVAGVGKEPRLGRWGRVPTARNGVALHSLKLL